MAGAAERLNHDEFWAPSRPGVEDQKDSVGAKKQ
jgi:hypothetical protein